MSHSGVLTQAGRPAAGDFNGDGYIDFSVKGDDGVWRIVLNQSTSSIAFSVVTFQIFTTQSFAGYGDSFHRPVPHHYSTFFPVGGTPANTNPDLAVRKESAPNSVAFDFLQNGFGVWDYVYSP